jgi:hypothetical protein
LPPLCAGLAEQEAAKRIAVYGRNELSGKPPQPLWRKYLEQVSFPRVVVDT